MRSSFEDLDAKQLIQKLKAMSKKVNRCIAH